MRGALGQRVPSRHELGHPRDRRVKKWAPVLGALALMVAACSAEPGAHDTPVNSPPPSSSGSPTGGTSVGPTDAESSTDPPEPSAGRVIASVQGRSIGPIALSGGTLAYPFADGSNEWNTVRISHDGALWTAARSEWSEGLINWVALSGHWLAYVDQSRRQDDASPNVMWRVWAVDLDGDSRVLLASNGETPDPYVPVVSGGGGYFFWSQAEKDRSASEFAWEPDWQEPRLLLRFAELTPGSETYSRDGVVYLGPNGRGLKGHTAGGDCWRVSMDGGPPTALTHTALAMGCAASDDTLIWTQHLPPDDPRKAEVGEQPFTTWTLDLDDPDAAPTQVYEGIQSGLFPVAGDEFAAWANVGRSFIMRSSTSGETTRVRGGMSIAASGSHLAVAQPAGHKWKIMLYDAP